MQQAPASAAMRLADSEMQSRYMSGMRATPATTLMARSRSSRSGAPRPATAKCSAK